jgi:hypothetical protein
MTLRSATFQGRVMKRQTRKGRESELDPRPSGTDRLMSG